MVTFGHVTDGGHTIRSAIVIGIDLAGILGGRVASAEGGSMPSGVGYEEGISSPAVSSPSGVRDRAPAKNGFWHILKATERSFLYLYDKNLRRTICISIPRTPNSGGT